MPSSALAHLGDVGQAAERAVPAVEQVTIAQVGRAAPVQPDVADRLGRLEQRPELHGTRRPAGHVGGQLDQHGEGPLAAAGGHGPGHLGAAFDGPVEPLALCRGRLDCLSRAEGLVSDQVADVGHGPVLAGLDEPVAVELVDVGLHDVDLGADDLQQLAQHAAGRRVGGTVVLGKQVVKTVVWHGGHGVIWVRTRESGTSGDKMATWAGLTARGGSAGSGGGKGDGDPPGRLGAQRLGQRGQGVDRGRRVGQRGDGRQAGDQGVVHARHGLDGRDDVAEDHSLAERPVVVRVRRHQCGPDRGRHAGPLVVRSDADAGGQHDEGDLAGRDPHRQMRVAAGVQAGRQAERSASTGWPVVPPMVRCTNWLRPSDSSTLLALPMPAWARAKSW